MIHLKLSKRASAPIALSTNSGSSGFRVSGMPSANSRMAKRCLAASCATSIPAFAISALEQSFSKVVHCDSRNDLMRALISSLTASSVSFFALNSPVWTSMVHQQQLS